MHADGMHADERGHTWIVPLVTEERLVTPSNRTPQRTETVIVTIGCPCGARRPVGWPN